MNPIYFGSVDIPSDALHYSLHPQWLYGLLGMEEGVTGNESPCPPSSYC